MEDTIMMDLKITLVDRESYLYDISLSPPSSSQDYCCSSPSNELMMLEDEYYQHPDTIAHHDADFSCLPDELLMEIFSYLSPIPNYIRLRRLNKDWKVYFEKILTRQVSFHLAYSQWIDIASVSMHNLSETMKLLPNVEQVVVYNINNIEDCSLFRLFKKNFKKLKRIKFTNCIFRNCVWLVIPSLRKFEMSN
ncbi:Hypothetical protein NAEGRDRAFT_73487 [Naegleria gruberi]|uniref:F-box domain-containing protein n=1 Tax=Naegleria gruberi TaxID=5762 RepID=D2VWS6_NAEGR|nr:uncharacterized protein NAEGRDRAFT_73487 [Naegleria gruberi]EFC38676.1 Hypothetical protein NAEGRDRAFT_73487 [Naegleria gruberi]|eukprot:XP_002671420.1 Hypothetical protein NAEGRDRAFT_73487 [Naegleria gruberi strain NEG-M]